MRWVEIRKINAVRLVGALIAGVLILPIVTPAQGQEQTFHGSESAPKVDYEARYAAAAPLVGSEAGRQALADCLEAYGGVEKLEALQGYRLHYSMSKRMTENPVQVVKSVAQGRRYLRDEGEMLRILNGQECWFTKGDEVAEMDDGRYRAELFSYLTLAMPLAAETERFDGVRFGKVEGDPLSYLYFDKADSVLVVLGIDDENHLIRTSTGVIRQGEQHFVFINEFDDFREVEGYWFPHKLVNISMGLRVAESVVKKVEVNPDFDKGTFLPPGGGK